MKPEDKAVVQQALEAMEYHTEQTRPIWKTEQAITALRQLLEQPEPVFCEYCGGNDDADFGLPTDHCTDCARPDPAQPAPVQEEKQSEIFCGVDFADGVLSVSVLRRRPNDVAELLHSEQIDLPLSAQPADHGDELTIAYLDGVHTGKQLAKREWVDLTDEEIMDRWPIETRIEFARAIEAKLREKNGGAAQPADHTEQHLDMVRALDALLVVQDELCSIDHHGYCQSHYLDNVNSHGGCRVANARALVAKVRGKP
jgi:hypothetical protein